MSKMDRFKRRNRSRERKEKPQAIPAPRPDPVHVEIEIAETNRPTPERYARGSWIEPTGKDAAAHLLIDRHVDMIGKLYATGQLSYAQEASARQFQEIVAAWLAELALAGYRSCLVDGGGGYDAGEGNPAVKAAHHAMQRRLGAVRYAFLRMETEKPSDGVPRDLAALRRALDAFAGER
jgi:hypothetical protein